MFHVRLVGVFALEDARELYARSSAFAVRNGYSLMLTDLTRSTGISPEARRFVTDQVRGEDRSTVRNLTANANFGASLPVRAVTTLYYSAMKIVSKTEMPMIIVKTEAEARAWLEKRRAAILQTMADTVSRYRSVSG